MSTQETSFTYLIATFSTTDVNDDIAVRELGQSLRNDGLSTTKGTRNGGRSTLYATRTLVSLLDLRMKDLSLKGIVSTEYADR